MKDIAIAPVVEGWESLEINREMDTDYEYILAPSIHEKHNAKSDVWYKYKQALFLSQSKETRELQRHIDQQGGLVMINTITIGHHEPYVKGIVATAKYIEKIVDEIELGKTIHHRKLEKFEKFEIPTQSTNQKDFNMFVEVVVFLWLRYKPLNMQKTLTERWICKLLNHLQKHLPDMDMTVERYYKEGYSTARDPKNIMMRYVPSTAVKSGNLVPKNHQKLLKIDSPVNFSMFTVPEGVLVTWGPNKNQKFAKAFKELMDKAENQIQSQE